MNGRELFDKIQQVSSLQDLLQKIQGKTKAETQSKQENMVEKVGDLSIKTGCCPLFPNDEYDHYEGNINKGILKKVDNLELYLQDILVFGKGKGGASDITLRHKITGEWVFISSKYYLDDEKKSIDKYDVEKILAVVRKYSHKYAIFKIYLLVNNKQKVLELIKASQSTNDYIRENIHHIIGINDLTVYFSNLKNAIQGLSFDKINSHLGNEKVPLNLRFHQKLIVHKLSAQIDSQQINLLLGAKARSGKTYMVGGLIAKRYKKLGHMNALIITPAPTETLTQFTNDLFHKFRDFQEFNVVEIKQGRDFAGLVLNPKNNNIIIVSKQLLDDYVLEKTVMAIQQLVLDLIVFDENHFHGTTDMAKHILQSYSSPNTARLFLTATFMKPLTEWTIPEEARFYWDLEDEQMCKARDTTGLIKKHGEDVKIFLSVENQERELNVYDKMPDLHILTNMMDHAKYAVIKERIKDTTYGFSNSTLLCGQYPDEVDTVLRYITGSDKETDYPDGDQSMFGRIKRMSIASNSRTKLNNGDFTTQLWFLPYGVGMKIDPVSNHVRERMMKNPVLKKYEIKIVNSIQKEHKLDDLKGQIDQWELDAHAEGKAGLILLAGNQLTLGITLPMVDIVFLMNDVQSSDKIVQMMYRCMTEGLANPINNGLKKIGFVVDLNISRVLNTLLDYDIHKKDLIAEHKITYIVERRLIHIDDDLFQSKENRKVLVKKLMEIWKANPVHHLNTLLRKIENEIIVLDTQDQRQINQLYFAKGNGNVNIQVKMDDEIEEPLPTGLVMTKHPVVNDDETEVSVGDKDEDSNTNDEIDNNKTIQISLTRDVLPFIVPFSCILTIATDNTDILEMLDVVQNDISLLSVFEDQSFIWWNKPDIIKLIREIVSKYVKKNSTIYNIAIQFKGLLHSLIDRPKELLELIDQCLKPKQKEKQENGEVFTPMPLVNDMLDQLNQHYSAEHGGQSIFANPDLKWFDPATGMGNYPVAVYLRLMTGLQQMFPVEQDRKRHILEKMLYMSELNKKNVFICREIFNMDGKIKLNLYEGDTLTLDVKQEWPVVETFDVVMGNPPYNKGGIRSHTGKQLGEKNETIWTKFVEKTLDVWLKPNGYLVFINPLSWLKKSHSLHNRMLEKHVVWLKLWDNSQSKGAINADIPISLFVLHNRFNNTKKETMIISILKRRGLTTTTTEYLDPKYSVPLAFHSIFKKLAEFIETKNAVLEYNTKTVKSIGTKAKIPTGYSLEDGWAVDTYTIKDGLMVKKMTEPHPDTNKRKLIVANKSSFKGAFLDNGKLGLTGNDKTYILGDQLELIQKLLTFKICEIISHFTKYRQDFMEKDVYAYIPDIRKLGITDITEEEFYKLIGLTSKEIQQIGGSEPEMKDPVIKNTVIEQPLVVKPKRKFKIVKRLIDK